MLHRSHPARPPHWLYGFTNHCSDATAYTRTSCPRRHGPSSLETKISHRPRDCTS